ncbi:hypothetical protein LSH36_20g13049 [Paralvinella palmiformis]|uniref:TNF receptor-associated factor 6 n=1 Tax=Paralvinella palmiformis TaxID=53620 RepID=A0AAD9NH69_9ANNE|nr:hypothetical protein LSH36_20g13049 [Paralvinella palmiformis]
MDCKYCHKTYRKKEMERHVHLECPRATVECLFQRFGCQQKFERSEEDEHMRREVVKHLSLLCYHFPVTNPLGPVKYYDISQSAPVISTLASITAPPTLGLSTDPGFCSDYSGTSTVYSTAPNRYPIAHSMEVQSSDAPLLPHTKPPTASCFPINIPHNSYEHQCRPNTFPLEPEPWRSEETTRELVTRLKLTVEDQKNQLKQQGMKLQQQERTIRQLDVQLKEVEGRFCNGIYIWRIREYSQKRKDAIERKATVHHSPGFYTSPHGYKMCIRANLNGVESGTGTHLSLFVHVMQGEYDEILPWPFLGHVVLSILDQTWRKTRYQ